MLLLRVSCLTVLALVALSVGAQAAPVDDTDGWCKLDESSWDPRLEAVALSVQPRLVAAGPAGPPPERATLPIVLWIPPSVERPRASCRALNLQVNLARRLFEWNRTGIELEARREYLPRALECDALLSDPEVDGLCTKAAIDERVRRSRATKKRTTFDEKSVNVYFVEEPITGVCCSINRRIVYLGTVARADTLAHELGHVLGLDHGTCAEQSERPKPIDDDSQQVSNVMSLDWRPRWTISKAQTRKMRKLVKRRTGVLQPWGWPATRQRLHACNTTWSGRTVGSDEPSTADSFQSKDDGCDPLLRWLDCEECGPLETHVSGVDVRDVDDCLSGALALVGSQATLASGIDHRGALLGEHARFEQEALTWLGDEVRKRSWAPMVAHEMAVERERVRIARVAAEYVRWKARGLEGNLSKLKRALAAIERVAKQEQPYGEVQADVQGKAALLEKTMEAVEEPDSGMPAHILEQLEKLKREQAFERVRGLVFGDVSAFSTFPSQQLQADVFLLEPELEEFANALEDLSVDMPEAPDASGRVRESSRELRALGEDHRELSYWRVVLGGGVGGLVSRASE